MASIVVRVTLLKGSCSVRDQPEVWLCVLSAKDFGFLAPNSDICLDQINLAARNLAISINGFIPMPQKKLNLGAKVSISSPVLIPVLTYSNPLHNV